MDPTMVSMFPIAMVEGVRAYRRAWSRRENPSYIQLRRVLRRCLCSSTRLGHMQAMIRHR
jgi:hypothetical protein